jgi:uncharacterized protein (DUF736 family)
MTEKPQLKVNNRCGAAWERESKQTKEKFISLELELTPELQNLLTNASKVNSKTGNKIVNLTMFANKDKTQDNHPNYRVVLPKSL